MKYALNEWIFQSDLATEGKFCAPGDSGSVVWDIRGCVVGLIFRGIRVTNSDDEGFGYVTPIEDVFKDIKDFSKGQITDIRVAVD